MEYFVKKFFQKEMNDDVEESEDYNNKETNGLHRRSFDNLRISVNNKKNKVSV